MTTLNQRASFIGGLFIAMAAMFLALPNLVSANAGALSTTSYEDTFQYTIDQTKKLYEDSLNNDRADSTISSKLKELHERIVMFDVFQSSGSSGDASYSYSVGSQGTNIQNVMTRIRDLRSLMANKSEGDFCQIDSIDDVYSLKAGITCLQKILRGEEGSVPVNRPAPTPTYPSCPGCLAPGTYSSSRPDLQELSKILSAVQSRVQQLGVINSSGGTAYNSGTGAGEGASTNTGAGCSASNSCGGPTIREPEEVFDFKIPSSPSRSDSEVAAIRSLLEQVLKRIEELLANN